MNTDMRFPLHWPEGRPRTPSSKRTRSRFRITPGKARDELFRELARMGARGGVLSTNVELKQNGEPRADRRDPIDPGVAVYFTRKGRELCFSCDRWDTVAENIWAVCKTIEALRGIDRWGTGDAVDAAFTGFTALPVAKKDVPWSAVLGLPAHTPTEEVQRRHRLLAMEHHPDRGGDTEKMQQINDAFERFKKERGLT